MIFVLKNTINNKEQFFRLREVEDFDYLFHLFPRTHEIALGSDGLEDAARNIAAYISKSSRYHAWVADNNMIKAEIEQAAEAPKPKRLKLDSKFADKVDLWVQKRIAEDRHLIARDSTFVADPGRLREPELDEKPEKGIIGSIKWAIKQAKKIKQSR
jgi:hypothetical protein